MKPIGPYRQSPAPAVDENGAAKNVLSSYMTERPSLYPILFADFGKRQMIDHGTTPWVGRFLAWLLLVLILQATSFVGQASSAELRLYAASSMREIVEIAATSFEQQSGIDVVPVFGASSALARQIEQGAPADLFLSANLQWMDHLVSRDLILIESQRIVFANSLVLIAPPADQTNALSQDRSVERDLSVVEQEAQFPLALLQDGRLAIADPKHVPAGIYARQVLTSLGLWQDLQSRIAPAGNVRQALAFVARGEAPLGIVYRSDVGMPVGVSNAEQGSSANVSVLGAFDPSLHEPIRYPLAILKASENSNAASALMALFASDEIQKAAKRLGFSEPDLTDASITEQIWSTPGSLALSHSMTALTNRPSAGREVSRTVLSNHVRR